jgi:hypothetical protein
MTMDPLISLARAEIEKRTKILDGIRQLKSGGTLERSEAATTSLFGHQLRSLLHDFRQHASKARKEMEAARKREPLSDAQQHVVAELLQLLEQIEAECRTTQPLVQPQTG